MFKKIISMAVIVAVLMAVSGVAYASEGDKGEKSLTRGAASLVLPGWGHYEVYTGEAFRQVITPTIDWYLEHLPPA